MKTLLTPPQTSPCQGREFFSSLGFTLIELIMVVVVMGILGAVVVPRFANQDAYQARFFRDDVLAAVRFAQNHAKTTGCFVEFEITNAAGFTINRDASCSTRATGTIPLASAYTTAVVRPGGGATTKPSNNITVAATRTIVFSPDGSVRSVDDAACVANTNINLTTGDRDDFIEVECATGYVHL